MQKISCCKFEIVIKEGERDVEEEMRGKRTKKEIKMNYLFWDKSSRSERRSTLRTSVFELVSVVYLKLWFFHFGSLFTLSLLLELIFSLICAFCSRFHRSFPHYFCCDPVEHKYCNFFFLLPGFSFVFSL